ncbi:hypothetical protein G5C60_07520 [Streptomyces sp. HC44]|uniref:Uncharacterized protein n=1 Tax=Streptomyces scabichelini TaxID=2711217 RepID=A0A6G4V0I0_9ACTN|nr:hypothetical protein [Streptomyces scabichelini]NGO07509.1 hypothetical protein [Streptomyces scabichelini]
MRDTVERELTGDVHLAYLDSDGRVLRVLRPATASAPELPKLDASAVDVRSGHPFEAPAESGGDAWRVIAPHHGQVEIRTAPGTGATFRILLPLHP